MEMTSCACRKAAREAKKSGENGGGGMALSQKQRMKVLNRELLIVAKQEKKLEKAALKARPAGWKTTLESKLPGKVYAGLEKAFAKGFSVVFSKGRGIIEKSYPKETIREDQSIREYALQVKGGRKELRQMVKSVKRSHARNMVMTTVEGVGLGVLGIGMPDIVLFLSAILRGVYETALNYGYDYIPREEQMLILKMMAASLSEGEDWQVRSEEIDDLLAGEECDTSEAAYRAQLQDTAAMFAVDMLLLKFIQGLPIVGMIGGAANPVYYRRILRYVQLKYRKRYLWKLYNDLEHSEKKGLVPR